jgi:hypothetical protein
MEKEKERNKCGKDDVLGKDETNNEIGSASFEDILKRSCC